jgi:hypothetical protein
MVRRMLAVSFLGLLAVACASPTLPLPPPEDPTIGPGVDADHVKLSVPCGGADPDALIVIVNNNPSVPGDEAVTGSIVSSCGSWDATAYAHSGDVLEITQEIGTERSQPLDFPIP